jgi:endoglucanase
MKVFKQSHLKNWQKHVTLKMFLLCLPLGLFADNIQNDTTKTIDIFSANQLLARTLNIGFTLDASKEGDWGHSLNGNEFILIKEAGFTAIRLPIQWVAHMDLIKPYNIDKNFLARVDWAIEQALKNKLAIILDNHLDEQLMARPSESREHFLSLWSQLSVYYKSFSQNVMFEIMAEPHAQLENVWEEYFTDALKIIRKNNPKRPVLIGPVLHNLPYKINTLHLPENDEYIIATFHLYTPIQFTMQGEQWFPIGKPMEWIGAKWLGTDAEKAEVIKYMDVDSGPC